MCVVTEKRQIVKLQKQTNQTHNVNNSNANQLPPFERPPASSNDLWKLCVFVKIIGGRSKTVHFCVGQQRSFKRVAFQKRFHCKHIFFMCFYGYNSCKFKRTQQLYYSASYMWLIPWDPVHAHAWLSCTCMQGVCFNFCMQKGSYEYEYSAILDLRT